MSPTVVAAPDPRAQAWRRLPACAEVVPSHPQDGAVATADRTIAHSILCEGGIVGCARILVAGYAPLTLPRAFLLF
jgi:hypothetical protein